MDFFLPLLGIRLDELEPPTNEDIESTQIDVSSSLRGIATVAFVAQIVSGIGILGSLTAYVVSRPGGIVEQISPDIAVFLLLLGAMITLFIFLGAIGFFVRVNRRLGRIIMNVDLEKVNLDMPGTKPVIVLYGLAIGLILIMGMYAYWLVFKYYMWAIAATALSFLVFSISLGVFLLAFLIEIVLIALGRTAPKMVRKILAAAD